jgi:hypothetical protein
MRIRGKEVRLYQHRLIAGGIGQVFKGIVMENGRKTRAKKKLDDAFAYIEDLEEVY